MKAKILISIIVILISFSLALAQEIQKIYVLDISIFRNDTVEIRSFTLATGLPKEIIDVPSNYSLQIVSSSNAVLYEKNLLVSFYIDIFNPGSEEQHSTRMEWSQLLRIPAFKDASRLRIFHSGSLIGEAGTPQEPSGIDMTLLAGGISLIIISVVVFIYLRKKIVEKSALENLKRKWQ